MSDQVRFRCLHCKRELPDGQQPCPFCCETGREIIGGNEDRVGIQERQTRVISTEEYNFPWLLAAIAVTVSSPFITAYLNQQIGIIVGVASGVLAFWLGTKAYILVKQISSESLTVQGAY
jgi:hypothetical protein